MCFPQGSPVLSFNTRTGPHEGLKSLSSLANDVPLFEATAHGLDLLDLPFKTDLRNLRAQTKADVPTRMLTNLTLRSNPEKQRKPDVLFSGCALGTEWTLGAPTCPPTSVLAPQCSVAISILQGVGLWKCGRVCRWSD